jgi:hypothetical protein
MTDYEKDFFEERSAIFEYEAGYTREQAEILAYKELKVKRDEKTNN